MIPDLCAWVYEYATSWLPSWPPAGAGGQGDGEREEESITSPRTSEALVRARDALAAIEGAGPRTPPGGGSLDARFRSPLARDPAADPHGVEGLVLQLNEIEAASLAAAEREALIRAATRLVERLRS